MRALHWVQRTRGWESTRPLKIISSVESAPSAKVGERRSLRGGFGWSLKARVHGFGRVGRRVGDAVNPSMGAPRLARVLSCAHAGVACAQPARGSGPCRGTTHPAWTVSCLRYPPREDQEKGNSNSNSSNSNSKSKGGWLAGSALRAKRPALLLLVDFPWIGRRNLSGAGRVGLAGIRAMDGAAASGTDSRRPRQSHPPGSKPAFSDQPHHHGGSAVRRSPPKARPAATCPCAILRDHGHPPPPGPCHAAVPASIYIEPALLQACPPKNSTR